MIPASAVALLLLMAAVITAYDEGKGEKAVVTVALLIIIFGLAYWATTIIIG